ncbi:unnamed protein product [Nesidiocoris tenuis]|uniref:B-cell lymphoma 9 beta-catenin binding domain-containing protein n=1 Tax=Nesidiocoris tenuis TaxID=355587 RepID=A0A6H5G9G0_9HEMI|nr:unnamed protein product [Nesidiocoris tenuis]
MGLPSESIHDGVQPLPSNVVTKQPVTMEAQYMQQQSQIFVFSTALANKAAEAVYNGHYNSIIAYHCAQPRTKKYLEGTNQPNSVMQNQCNSNMVVDQNNTKNTLNAQCNLMNAHTNNMMSDGIIPSLSDLNHEMGLTPPQPLAGVKVPDENLTPQQRQHREEQLATLRKMQQILFPEALQNSEEGAHIEPPISEHVDVSKGGSTNQNDWHKLQMPFYDDQKTRKPRNSGPPPTYQQATRSASVPIALQSPNPSSPNNTTSNLSLPSPRTCSGINSPADKVTSRIPGPSPTLESPNPARATSSNPPTPVSSHLSPKHKEKMNTTNEFSPSSTVSAQNSQHSPAFLFYRMAPTSIDGVIPVSTASSTSSELPPKSSDTPSTTTPDVPSRNYPNMALTDTNIPDTPVTTTSNPPQRKMDPSYCDSPQNNNMTNDRCHMPPMPNNFMQKCPSFADGQPPKLNSNEKEMTGPNYPCIGPDNVPLNPNRMPSVTASNKVAHFDPISSLAQMSQQLTNNVPNSPVNQPNLMTNMHQNMVPFNSPNAGQHMMGMGDMHHMSPAGPEHRMQNQMQPHFQPVRPQCSNSLSPGISVSPKTMQGYVVPPRAMPRGMGYNGASVQVKPNAPNTIQYLPSRPQSAACPRGPPSLDFLQRFSNPLSNLDSKVPTHNLQYFPNNYPPNNMNEMGMCSPHSNIRNPMRPANPNMMRMPNPQMQPMGFSGGPEGFQNSPCQMFGGPNSKGSANMGSNMGGGAAGGGMNPNMGGPMGGQMGSGIPSPMGGGGMGLAPDVSQPLPPSMGQSNNFKNSTFIGPTTADPNYAQQFHNFQQQLYATNTRGQLNTQAMGNNQHYFIPK